MKATQNVTLALPSEVLKQARHMAADRGVSVSRLLTQLFEEQVAKHSRYQAAYARQKRMLQGGFDLGFKGRIPWTRDELHER